MLRVLLLPGSLRSESFNLKLLKIAAQNLQNHSVDIVKSSEIEFPLYNEDIEKKQIPLIVQELGSRLKDADAVIISSPEYNYGISGILKNTIDWLSRLRPTPITSKPILLVSASPSNFAGTRGITHTKIPLDGLGNFVYPKSFSVGSCFTAFEGDNFKDEVIKQQFTKTISDFMEYAIQLKR